MFSQNLSIDSDDLSLVAVNETAFGAATSATTTLRLLDEHPDAKSKARLLVTPSASVTQPLSQRCALTCMAVDPTGRLLALGGIPHLNSVTLMRLFDFETVAVLRCTSRPATLSFSRSGAYLAAAVHNGCVTWCTMFPRHKRIPLKSPAYQIAWTACSRTGSEFLVVSSVVMATTGYFEQQRTICRSPFDSTRVFTPMGEPLREISIHSAWSSQCAMVVSPTDTELVLTGSSNGVLALTRFSSSSSSTSSPGGVLAQNVRTFPKAHDNRQVLSAAFDDAGERIVSCGRDRGVAVHSVLTGALLGRFSLPLDARICRFVLGSSLIAGVSNTPLCSRLAVMFPSLRGGGDQQQQQPGKERGVALLPHAGVADAVVLPGTRGSVLATLSTLSTWSRNQVSFVHLAFAAPVPLSFAENDAAAGAGAERAAAAAAVAAEDVQDDDDNNCCPFDAPPEEYEEYEEEDEETVDAAAAAAAQEEEEAPVVVRQQHSDGSVTLPGIVFDAHKSSASGRLKLVSLEREEEVSTTLLCFDPPVRKPPPSAKSDAFACSLDDLMSSSGGGGGGRRRK